MNPKIMTSKIDNNLFLKLIGEFRIPSSLCILETLKSIVENEDYCFCFFDLSDTSFMDSTALGLTTRLGLSCQNKINKKPIIIIDNEELINNFTTMGLINELFHLIKEKPDSKTSFSEDCLVMPEDSQSQKLILSAHQTLVDIDYKNFYKFEEVIKCLSH
jgi:ABC-type transporter Mla MlaB component